MEVEENCRIESEEQGFLIFLSEKQKAHLEVPQKRDNRITEFIVSNQEQLPKYQFEYMRV